MMQPWFTNAKLGIFVHWGSYAVGRRGSESWPVAWGHVPYDQYRSEMDGFTAEAYDPKAWADLFKRAGARYAVLTTKHHDGFTLWPTAEDSPSLSEKLGGRDLVGPFVDAVREVGLKTGLYFSHTDWSNLPHVGALTGLSEAEIAQRRAEKSNWRSLMEQGRPEQVGARARWADFLKLHRAQLRELLTQYHPVDLIWFDVHWGGERFGYDFPELRNFLHELNPQIVINSRMMGHGDYDTPEQFIPVYAPEGPWELCLTTNDTWSFTGREDHYKTPFEMVAMFCECLGMGGNLLLNVGPDERGIIPAEQVAMLETLGAWVQLHEEAVYGTQRGLPVGFSYNFTSFNPARDVLYVYLSHLPPADGGGTAIKGIRNKIKSATLLHSGQACSWKRIGGAPWLNVPGTLWVDVPRDDLHPLVSVLKLELDGPIDMYNGYGVEIDQN